MSSVVPRWLQALLVENFYSTCSIHEDEPNNLRNIYCLNCCTSVCEKCLPNHNNHGLLKVRIYKGTNVVRLDEADQLLDCSRIQIHKDRAGGIVLYIKSRPQSKFTGESVTIKCNGCEGRLQQNYFFCSLACKVFYLSTYCSNSSHIPQLLNKLGFN